MIKFTCKKEDMTQAINIVSKAVSPKSTITALEGIKLRLEPGKLELTGYDLEIGITTFIDCESEDSGEFVSRCRKLDGVRHLIVVNQPSAFV